VPLSVDPHANEVDTPIAINAQRSAQRPTDFMAISFFAPACSDALWSTGHCGSDGTARERLIATLTKSEDSANLHLLWALFVIASRRHGTRQKQ
jgi:hypothetical protein